MLMTGVPAIPRNIHVSFINASTKVTDAEALAVMEALQMQANRDFAPLWGFGATLMFVPTGQKPAHETWWLTLLDNSDTAGALGYHDITTGGLPIGKVFVGTDMAFGTSWSVTASHELLELLVDPYVNLCALNQTANAAGVLYAYEVCDACEQDSFGYSIGSVLVSDFVTPHWFEGWRAANSAQFDFGKHISAPLQLLPGGYIGAFQVTAGSGWQQITAETTPSNTRHRGQVGSRRERRAIAPANWVRSTV